MPLDIAPAGRTDEGRLGLVQPALSDRNAFLNVVCVDLWDCLKMRCGSTHQPRPPASRSAAPACAGEACHSPAPPLYL